VVGDLGDGATAEADDLMLSGPPGELVGGDLDIDPYASDLYASAPGGCGPKES
jgi:hypothetical protein